MDQEESVAAKVAHLLGFLAIVGIILFIGWNQPLRYRFLSQRDIDLIEHPPAPPTPRPVVRTNQPATPNPERPSWIWDRAKENPLDGRPYVPPQGKP
jgi:hypothetical protein